MGYLFVKTLTIMCVHFIESKLYSINLILEVDPDHNRVHNHLRTLRQEAVSHGVGHTDAGLPVYKDECAASGFPGSTADTVTVRL